MKFWARMGFSDGSELVVADYLKKNPRVDWMAPRFHDIRAEPWTLIEG